MNREAILPAGHVVLPAPRRIAAECYRRLFHSRTLRRRDARWRTDTWRFDRLSLVDTELSAGRRSRD
jgi:hypothetical protein